MPIHTNHYRYYEDVQLLRLQQIFYTRTKEAYIRLIALYTEHANFKIFFDAYYPKIIECIGEEINKHLHRQRF